MKPSQHSQILTNPSLMFKKTLSINSNSSNKQHDSAQQIADTFAKIHDTIDNLDSKVNLLLQKHEAQFLFAWRNHIKKIKKQLYDIKQRADEKQKLMNSNEKMVAIEKQMSLFRDESLKLYEQVEQRKSQLQIFRRKIHQQQRQLIELKKQNKQLIKSLKLSQAKNTLADEKIQSLEKQLEKYRSFQNEGMSSLRVSALNKSSGYGKLTMTKENFHKLHRKTIGFDKLDELQKSVPKLYTGMQKAKNLTLRQQHAQSFSIPTIKLQKLNRLSMTTKNKITEMSLVEIKNPIMNEKLSQQRQRASMYNNSKTQYRTFVMIEPNVYETDLKNWFLDCIKSIKKQISSRKTGFSSTSTDILKVESIEEFKTIDKLRLLEMFLQNEKLLLHMYQKIFPDRLKEIETFLNPNSTLINQNNRQHSAIESKMNKEQLQELQQNFINQNSNNNESESHKHNDSKIRVKSVSKASRSQPIRNRVIMKDGKLGLMC